LFLPLLITRCSLLPLPRCCVPVVDTLPISRDLFVFVRSVVILVRCSLLFVALFCVPLFRCVAVALLFTLRSVVTPLRMRFALRLLTLLQLLPLLPAVVRCMFALLRCPLRCCRFAFGACLIVLRSPRCRVLCSLRSFVAGYAFWCQRVSFGHVALCVVRFDVSLRCCFRALRVVCGLRCVPAAAHVVIHICSLPFVCAFDFALLVICC